MILITKNVIFMLSLSFTLISRRAKAGMFGVPINREMLKSSQSIPYIEVQSAPGSQHPVSDTRSQSDDNAEVFNEIEVDTFGDEGQELAKHGRVSQKKATLNSQTMPIQWKMFQMKNTGNEDTDISRVFTAKIYEGFSNDKHFDRENQVIYGIEQPIFDVNSNEVAESDKPHPEVTIERQAFGHTSHPRGLLTERVARQRKVSPFAPSAAPRLPFRLPFKPLAAPFIRGLQPKEPLRPRTPTKLRPPIKQPGGPQPLLRASVPMDQKRCHPERLGNKRRCQKSQMPTFWNPFMPFKLAPNVDPNTRQNVPKVHGKHNHFRNLAGKPRNRIGLFVDHNH